MKTGHQSFTDLLIFTQWRDTLRMPRTRAKAPAPSGAGIPISPPAL
ncbi:MAG: hypothetical protein J7605_27255 [Variovorax sp.]|nr:hypothetical protein [Variovorax sp.]